MLLQVTLGRCGIGCHRHACHSFLAQNPTTNSQISAEHTCMHLGSLEVHFLLTVSCCAALSRIRPILAFARHQPHTAAPSSCYHGHRHHFGRTAGLDCCAPRQRTNNKVRMERGIGGRIEDAFGAAKERGEAAFVTFVTAGYPSAKGMCLACSARWESVSSRRCRGRRCGTTRRGCAAVPWWLLLWFLTLARTRVRVSCRYATQTLPRFSWPCRRAVPR